VPDPRASRNAGKPPGGGPPRQLRRSRASRFRGRRERRVPTTGDHPSARSARAELPNAGLCWRGPPARCGGQKGRRASTRGPGRRRRRRRQPRAGLGRACAAGRQPGFPTPRRRPELPARERGSERSVPKPRRAPTRSAAWAKEPRRNPRQPGNEKWDEDPPTFTFGGVLSAFGGERSASRSTSMSMSMSMYIEVLQVMEGGRQAG
jgi:hypothetical protein